MSISNNRAGEPVHPLEKTATRISLPPQARKADHVKSLVNYGFPKEGLESQRMVNLQYIVPDDPASSSGGQEHPNFNEGSDEPLADEAHKISQDIEGKTLSSNKVSQSRSKDGGFATEGKLEGLDPIPHQEGGFGGEADQPSMEFGSNKISLVEGDNFPLLASALAIPAYRFNFDSGKQPPAIILEALKVTLDPSTMLTNKLAITDSHVQEDDPGDEHDVFRIELEYGPMKWVVYRRLYDFYRMHYYIKKRYLMGKIQSYPSFPNQLSYAFHRVTSFTSEEISQLALQRRKDLEQYLCMAIKMLSMRMQRELLEFLEVGGCSIWKYMGWKGREGYLSLRTTKTNELGCIPTVFGRWATCWVLIRDSYVAICRSVYDAQPTHVMLYNRFTRLDEVYARSTNPLNFHKLGLEDHRRRIDLRVEVKSDLHRWLSHLRASLKGSPWTKEHRFNSFSPIRSNVDAKWYIDGAGYFYDVSEAILNATDTIYIADWWLSPELYLRRPPSVYPEFRIDRLLKMKAEQGVDIYVLIYKEVTVSLPNNSQYTKRTLKQLHRNIKVQRHPDHVQTNGTWFWAHHEKIVVVDHHTAFLGGLDMCYGRFDDNSHRLADYNPLSENDTIFLGQDYCNARIRDNVDVQDHAKEVIDRKSHARMPWHDIAMSVSGAAARDVARHFIERWNFIKSSKARQRPHIPFLMPQGETSGERKESSGNCRIQVLRSSSEWSSGVEKENSIYNAYLECIRAAQHFIYIENQFFVTAAKGDPSYTVKNKIGKAIVERIKRAHQLKSPFRVIVIMPLMPAFPNELHESGANTIRLVMQWQYQSICRGKESIMGQLREAGIDPGDYIYFHGLRNYDLIPQSHLHLPEADAPPEASAEASEFDLGCQDPQLTLHEGCPHPTDA
ncbi:hypothetical protein L0F63_003778 [Massospora cicadina]|nr:hypothetical protein L0F63_003778 [Massospora cicadina]